MKYIFLGILPLMLSTICFSQSTDPVLYGVVNEDNLRTPPYDQWFVTGYNSYAPSSAILQSLKKTDFKSVTVEIFMGTWCGDSRREVPRFLKIMHELPFPSAKIRIITLGRQDSLYKQSPQHEEEGKGIFRVPVFIIYRNGAEVNRITEFPLFSLEKDLQTILTGQSYTPNYRFFPSIRNWLADGTLGDKNISAAGLATQLRSFFPAEREVNSLGYLLLAHGKPQEALKIFQVNANLFPESPTVLSSLGEGYYRTGDLPNAIRYLERSLEINKDPQQVKPLLKILYAAKGASE